jgi:pteridine reductase
MTILVTGGARRIGRLIVIQLAEAGHSVIIHYNNSEAEAQALLASLPGEGHLTIKSNLNDPSEVDKLFPELKRLNSLPDLLINNASTFHRRGLEAFTSSELLEDYQINFFAPLLLMRDFKNFVGEGSIINFLDKRVNFTEPESGPYLFAKKSLRDATLACSQEWAPKIRVNGIAPGPVLQPGIENPKLTNELKKVLQRIAQFINGNMSGEISIIA